MSTIAFCSGKGSPGATFAATNLSAAMARAGHPILLVDLDPAGGDVGCYLRLDPRRGLYPLLRMEGRISDAQKLLSEGEERSGFLAVCGFPEPSDLGSTESLQAVLTVSRASGRTVVADLGRVSDANATVATMADRVVLVVRPDLVSVLGAERAVRTLEVSGVTRERITALVSGLERRRPGDLVEMKDAMGVRVLGAVPLDRRGARKGLLAQEPAPTRRLRRAFDALASQIAEEMESARAALVAVPSIAKRVEVTA